MCMCMCLMSQNNNCHHYLRDSTLVISSDGPLNWVAEHEMFIHCLRLSVIEGGYNYYNMIAVIYKWKSV